uniref:DUF6377 domain-containing protein n=1 Tax=termite gut metagenome TaxID=433724 RepID=S0DEN3_9ZZZZ
MGTRFLIFILGSLYVSCSAASEPDRAIRSMAELDRYIEQKEHYVGLREERINLLKREAEGTDDLRERLDRYNRLFDEYKSYIYDSAFVYAQKTLDMADRLADEDEIILAKRNIAFCYLSSGLFKEASDIMSAIDVSGASSDAKKNYYSLMARLYCDMADYSDGVSFSADYTKRGILYCDSVITYLPAESFDMWNTVGLKRMQQRNFPAAIDAFQSLLNSDRVDDHTYAIATSCIGYMYWDMNDPDLGLYYLSQAAIGDIKSATKEGVALLNLAGLLYEKGDLERANRYIRIAMEDANFYNARHRKIQIGAVLPIIEKKRVEMVEKQRNSLVVFAVTVSLLFLLLLAATIVIYKQVKRLHKAKRTIQRQNQNFKQANAKLLETNEIKDEYIAQSLYGKSEYIDRLENLYKIINRKVVARQYDDIQSYLKESDLKKERENMYSSFDQTFLKLFPGFIEEYNDLFRPEDRVVFDSARGLTPELRIFALIRLGINESERIAKFLDYSVNTINTYKTKVKNKSVVSNEQFEPKIMEIKTVRMMPQ